LPPKMAPYEVVIVPILGKQEDPQVLAAARALAERLRGRFRVRLDDREAYTPGWKFNEWELRGVPVRVEIGPRDVASGQVVLVRRTGLTKDAVSTDAAPEAIATALNEIQQEMYSRAKVYLDSHTTAAATLDEAVERLQERRGFVKVGWCERQECEDTLREKSGASPRVIPLDERPSGETCVVCGRPATVWMYWARAY